jgi:hypothetical protein
MLRMAHYPIMWKFAQIIVIPKPGKPANEVHCYCPISLLPVTSKLFETLLLKRIRNDLDLSTVIPDYQFGFREYKKVQNRKQDCNKPGRENMVYSSFL